MPSHCLLASVVSAEILSVNFIEEPLYLMTHFSLAAFKTVSLSCDSFIVSLSMWISLCLPFMEIVVCVDLENF